MTIRQIYKYAAVVAVALLALPAHGGAFDARSRATLNQPQAARHGMQARTDAPTLYYSVILQANSPQALHQLDSIGAVVWHQRDNIVLCSVPRSQISVVDHSAFVDRAQIGARTSSVIDRSRSATGIDGVHTASQLGLPADYDGRGVVAGLCDIGFDPDHIAFAGRVGLTTNYVDSLALRNEHVETGHVAYNTDETHATHVAGILAGGFRGNQYYGYATGATIAASTSAELSDVALLCGIEDIIAYAAQQGMPAVINLSVGSFLGPHDGTDLVNRYLDLLGREAIIVFSAGNNGVNKYSLSHTFADADGQIGTCLESIRSWNGHNVLGALDVWSADGTAFEMQLFGWDQIDKREVFATPWFGGEDASYEVTAANEAGWGEHFVADSRFMATGGTDAGNGRYMMAVDYDYDPVGDLPGGRGWARYVAGWRIRAKRGTRIDAYTDGTHSFLRNYGAPGAVDGNSDCTISNLGCNRNTVIVGSWNSRNTIPQLDADDRQAADMEFDFANDRASDFSSYGTLLDGRRLPHFCAPGNYVVSALSTPYHGLHPLDETTAFAQTVDGRTYRWFGQCGTSMASPAAAGTFALWLQADPTLTVEQVREIAMTTARHDGLTNLDDPRWGAGALDALAGLREVVRRAGVNSLGSGDDLPVLVTVEGRRIIVDAPDGMPVTAYDAAGRPIDIAAEQSPGIYIVVAGATTRKVTVRP